LSGAKHSLLEGGIRVPFLVSGPSIEAGSVCRVPVVGYDFLPTFYELAGGTGELPNEVDGGSFASLLREPEGSTVIRNVEGLIFSRPSKRSAAIRHGNLKLLAKINARREIQSVQLFNVRKDIAESNDLSQKLPEKAKALYSRLKTFLESHEDPSPTFKTRKSGV
jgi:arylsulfatase A-like enzyme